MNRALLLLTAFLVANSCSQPDKRKELLSATALSLKVSFEAGPASLRYNPADCECPPFEALAGERWIRVALPLDAEPGSASSQFLSRARDDREDGNLATYRVLLELDSSTPGFCANGTPYFQVELLDD